MEGAVTCAQPGPVGAGPEAAGAGVAAGAEGQRGRGMLAGGRGGDWEEVKGVGGRPGTGEPDYGKLRREEWPLGGSVKWKSRLLRASDLGLPLANLRPCFWQTQRWCEELKDI